MALPLSGPISMSQINTELSFPATTVISLNDASVRALAGVPAGVISLSDFYGKSTAVAESIIFASSYGIPAPTQPAWSPAASIWTTVFSTEAISVTSTGNTAARFFGATASDTSNAYTLGGYIAQNNPVFDARVDQYNFPTKTQTNGIGSMPQPRVSSFGGYDGSAFVYSLGGFATTTVTTTVSDRFNVTTLTGSATTSVPLAVQRGQGAGNTMRDSASLYIAAYTPSFTPRGYAQKFTYATQTYGANIALNQNNVRYSVVLNKTNAAYFCFGDAVSPATPTGTNFIIKYDTTTFAQSTITFGVPAPAGSASAQTVQNEGTNWGHIISGFQGPAYTSTRKKLFYATDTTAYMPTLPVRVGSGAPRTSWAAGCETPITYAY